MRGPNDAHTWERNLLNAMRPEAVPVPLPGLLPEDGNDTPLLEAPEEVPLGLPLAVEYIQDILPGMEGCGDPECNGCEIADHGGKNWCDKCQGWIDGEPCDLT